MRDNFIYNVDWQLKDSERSEMYHFILFELFYSQLGGEKSVDRYNN